MKVIIALLALVPLTARADIETDKTVGHCIAYLATMQKIPAMEVALGMADNQTRAMSYSKLWMREVQNNKNNKSHLEYMVFSASKACREIGIRPADY
jgi:hypothetical protein